MWAKSRWPFITSAAANQAYRRTIAYCSSKLSQSILMREQFQRILQTLPICCEAQALFAACDADGDHRVSIAELKLHAENHGLKLNLDQLNAAMKLLGNGAGFASFCDWFLQQKGGDTADEIAAVCEFVLMFC